MSQVYIPFRYDMRRESLAHAKHCTTRSKRYGYPGDTFDLDGTIFELVAVQRRPIGHVGSRLYRFEGFATKEDFIEVWNELHPGRGYSEASDLPYYVHWFQQVGHKVPLLSCSFCGCEVLPYDEGVDFPLSDLNFDPRFCCSTACARQVA